MSIQLHFDTKNKGAIEIWKNEAGVVLISCCIIGSEKIKQSIYFDKAFDHFL